MLVLTISRVNGENKKWAHLEIMGVTIRITAKVQANTIRLVIDAPKIVRIFRRDFFNSEEK